LSFSNSYYSINIQFFSFNFNNSYIVALSESIFKLAVTPHIREKNGFKQRYIKIRFGMSFRKIKFYFL